MNVANHAADATLQSFAVGTSIQAKATINLTGDYLSDATVDTQAIPLQPLFAVYAPQVTNLSGQTEIHATLHGPLKNTQLLQAHVTIPTLKMAYGNAVRLAAVTPVNIDYKNGVITLQRSSIRGTDTDLQFQGSIPTVGNSPMSLLLLGTVNLNSRNCSTRIPEAPANFGSTLILRAFGQSDLDGQIKIVDANIASSDLPVGLQHCNGSFTLTKDRINIRSFQGAVGGGTITAQGGVAYNRGIQFDWEWLQRVFVYFTPKAFARISMEICGSRVEENAVLGGSVDLSDLSLTPAFDLTSFISSFSGGVTTPPSRGFSQNVRLNLAVHSTNNVNVTSRTLSVDGTANLQVRGTVADPVIFGRVNLKAETSS